MFLSHAQTHLKNKISQGGLYQRLEEQLLAREKYQIEIRHMTLDQHFKTNHIHIIKQLPELISDQVIEHILINLVFSRIKCTVALASNYTTLNGESKFI